MPRPALKLAGALALLVLAATPVAPVAALERAPAASPGTVLATLSVGPKPQDAVVSPDGRFAYLTTLDDGVLAEIDLGDFTVTRTLQVGVTAGAIVWNDGRLVVADAASGTLVTVDPATFRIESTLPTGADPIALSASADGSTIVFSGWEARSIGVVDLGQGRSSLLNIDGKPWGIDLFAGGTRAAIADTTNGRVVIVTVGAQSEMVATVGVGGRPSYVAVSPDERVAYVANADNGTVDVVDLESFAVADTFSVGGKPWGVAVSADGRYVYVPDNSGGTMIAIDAATGSVLGVTPTGTHPDFVALSPDGSLVLVPNSGSDTLSIVQGHSVPGASVADPADDSSGGATGVDGESASSGAGQGAGSPVVLATAVGVPLGLLAVAAVVVVLLLRRRRGAPVVAADGVPAPAAAVEAPSAAPTMTVRLTKSPGVRLTKD